MKIQSYTGTTRAWGTDVKVEYDNDTLTLTGISIEHARQVVDAIEGVERGVVISLAERRQERRPRRFQ